MTITLADAFLRSTAHGLVERATVEQVRARLRQARKFKFDTAASIHAAEVVRDCPDVIASEHRLARAPFEVTWVEFDFRNFWETVNGTPAAPSADDVVGYLIDHDRIYGVTNHALGKEPALLPICYDLHSPWEVQAQLDFCATMTTSRGQLDRFMWGSVLERLLTDEQRRDLRAAHSAIVLPIPEPYLSAPGLSVMLQECTGDLRNVLALLFLLNRPAVTSFGEPTPPQRTFSRGKSVRTSSHQVVTIPLDPRPSIRQVGTTSDVKDDQKRSREFRGKRGHWAYSRDAHEYAQIAGCVHEWVEANDFGNVATVEPQRYRCAACNGRRWWRNRAEVPEPDDRMYRVTT